LKKEITSLDVAQYAGPEFKAQDHKKKKKERKDKKKMYKGRGEKSKIQN
jgi:hypothetical protein